MPQYPVPTTHSIIVGTDSGVLYMEFEQGDGTAILPGDLVQFNNPPNDCTVKAGAADSEEIIGVAEIHISSPTLRGADRVTAYQEGDPVLVFRGSTICMLRIASSEQIQCGEFVQAAASGEVKAYVCGTDNDCQRVAQALETTAQDTTTFQWGQFALERFG
jgi:hypothetical protein